MKIDVSDDLTRQYEELSARWFGTAGVTEAIERLIGSELRKLRASGHETDGLTGCWTRHQLEHDVHGVTWKWCHQSDTRYQNRYLCLDIDNFKHYLDTHGLPAGDAVLVAIASQLRELYPGQNIYRVGGDEFVVELGDIFLLPLTPIPDIVIKHSVVEVVVNCNRERLHHINRAIVFHLDEGIVKASVHGTQFIFNYPTTEGDR